LDKTPEDVAVELQLELAKMTVSNSQLADVFIGQVAAVNQQVATKMAEVDSFLSTKQLDVPFYRTSKNQAGKIVGGMLEHFVNNAAFNIVFALHRTIVTGIDWNIRDAEEQEIMTAMGLNGQNHFFPNIDVVKMNWNGWNAGINPAHTIYQFHMLSNTTTCASYAKLNSGEISGYAFQGVTNQWGLCGANFQMKPGGYLNPHPFVTTGSGEILFAWLATVSGRVPLDRENPKWGFYPYLDIDATI
jgi:hypothetical protein